MKKNITTIIVLALVTLNVVLTGIIMFVMVPSLNKVNTLLTKVSNIIDLELEHPDEKTGEVSMADREDKTIDTKIQITLMSDNDGKTHYAAIDSITITLNKKADSYDEVSKVFDSNKTYIQDIITNIYTQYTFKKAQISGAEIKVKALEQISKHFDGADCFLNIGFGNLRFN